MSTKRTKYIKITTTSGHIITYATMNEEELQAMQQWLIDAGYATQAMQQAMQDMQDEFNNVH